MTEKLCLNPDCEREPLTMRGYFTISIDGPIGFISIRAFNCPKCGRIAWFDREDPE